MSSGLHLIDVLDLPAMTSHDKEQSLRQSLADYGTSAGRLAEQIEVESDRMHQLSQVNGNDSEGVTLVLRAERLRALSGLRSRWCKALSGAEDAQLGLDRLVFLRSVHRRETARDA